MIYVCFVVVFLSRNFFFFVVVVNLFLYVLWRHLLPRSIFKTAASSAG